MVEAGVEVMAEREDTSDERLQVGCPASNFTSLSLFFLRDDGWHPHPTVSLEVVQSLQNSCLSNLVVLDSSLGREGFCACFTMHTAHPFTM